LQWAARNGQINAAKLLVARGAYINQPDPSGQTPLMDAARHGDADMVRFLLSRGADVNAKAQNNFTALHAAAERNNVEAGRILLEHDADPTVERNGRPVPEEFLRLIRRPAPDTEAQERQGA
jgi:ankyrin repeat protein